MPPHMAMLTTMAPNAARNSTDAAAIIVGELIKWHDIVMHSFLWELSRLENIMPEIAHRVSDGRHGWSN